MKNLILLLAMSFSVSAMAVDYTCSGTEPFWGMSIKGDKLSYDYYGEVEVNKTEKILSQKFMAARADDFGVVAKARKATATIVLNDQCSDGMSDQTYSHSAVLDIKALPMVLEGCCNVTPATK
ncbi:hypothetical protein SHI21_03645 [Bacteriovorax sp. PP10]|uniref:Uncharacterized protein n=1 Tax=Bacteriovorax antarcticus TaxID=3088717 RepID=A0ABU5VUF6_9BACT|nr:hypothetical protein [Bacteriovorax sp. PP10]MEA9355275.1 hypothetical protein [Bacteriovorax sp. PP10]